MPECRECERLRNALLRIQMGKIQADNEHPLGEYFSMVSRFSKIAKEALAHGKED